MERIQKFLYKTVFGRIILKILIKPPVSKIGGYLLSSKVSSLCIKRFINKNKINMEDYETTKFSSFNDFFTRKIIPSKRPVDLSEKAFISPCDGVLTVYDITEDSMFYIKNSVYTLTELTGVDCSEFNGGKCLVFRLAVHNYHRYCFSDDGYIEKDTKIKGVLHTVMPVSNEFKVFARNCREVTWLDLKNFGKVIQIEVGALLVGKISNIKNITQFKKGQEKGMFEFGGSTIVMLTKKDAFEIRKDILENSKKDIETNVLMGEKISL